jgi:hypothetical protein
MVRSVGVVADPAVLAGGCVLPEERSPLLGVAAVTGLVDVRAREQEVSIEPWEL